jgi:hypothetical protein
LIIVKPKKNTAIPTIDPIVKPIPGPVVIQLSYKPPEAYRKRGIPDKMVSKATVFMKMGNRCFPIKCRMKSGPAGPMDLTVGFNRNM